MAKYMKLTENLRLSDEWLTAVRRMLNRHVEMKVDDRRMNN